MKINPLISDEHLSKVCGLKNPDIETCTFMTLGPDGFKCGKDDEDIRRHLEERLRKGTMRSKGDNCIGWVNLHAPSDKIHVHIIRVDGAEEDHVFDPDPEDKWFKELEALIDSKMFDHVKLYSGMWMLVDDDGYARERATNGKATMMCMIMSDTIIGNKG